MTNLHRDLLEFAARWHRASQQAGAAAAEADSRFIQGHLTGMSLMLKNGAEQIEALIAKDFARLDPSGFNPRRRASEHVRQRTILH